MSTYSHPGISFDQGKFDPMRIMAVTHTLTEHPLLQLPKLVALCGRLEKVRYHDDQANAGTNFTTAPQTNAAKRSALETISDIENAKAWLALHNIQMDEEYRGLVDEVLDSVRSRVEAKDPGMHARAGWIFVTSPNAVTPYHMDHEHNFILQIRGTKTVHVFPPLDRGIVTERSLELFHHDWSRELVVYDKTFESRASVLELRPGMGGYMPQTSPHWVQNGPEVSVTISFTYHTRAVRERELLHKGNYKLRKWGLAPRPVGQSRSIDAAKLRLFSAMEVGARMRRRLGGKQLQDPRKLAYAVG
ncbi:MAG TPA: cupin-like domain-containing protein [Planctomycetota bacterium]|nr:cupin-like domain-containing protein [Planctomycetota bacterium]